MERSSEMVNIIATLDKEQKDDMKFRMKDLVNVCVCSECNALLQFNREDIDRTKILPHVKCICGNMVQLHSKYYKEEDTY